MFLRSHTPLGIYTIKGIQPRLPHPSIFSPKDLPLTFSSLNPLQKYFPQVLPLLNQCPSERSSWGDSECFILMDFLTNLSFLKSHLLQMSIEDFKQYAVKIMLQEVEEGDYIFRKGDIGQDVYWLIKGEVKFYDHK